MEIELAALRDELIEAASQAPENGVAFTVGPIEQEFGIELKKDARAKAGFKAWVVSADLEAASPAPPPTRSRSA